MNNPEKEKNDLVFELSRYQEGKGLIAVFRSILGDGPNDTSADAKINQLTPTSLIQLYMSFHGIPGNAVDLINLVWAVTHGKHKSFRVLEKLLVRTYGDSQEMVIDDIEKWVLDEEGTLVVYLETDQTKVDVKEYPGFPDGWEQQRDGNWMPKTQKERAEAKLKEDTRRIQEQLKKISTRDITLTFEMDDDARDNLMAMVDGTHKPDIFDPPGLQEAGSDIEKRLNAFGILSDRQIIEGNDDATSHDNADITSGE
jgi:hypothetical protein